MTVDLSVAIPASIADLADSDENVVVRATFQEWKVLRAAHETCVKIAFQEGNILSALQGAHIADAFVDEVAEGSVPSLKENNEPEAGTELTVTFPVRTFAAVMVSLAVLKAQPDMPAPEDTDDQGKEILAALASAWATFVPQIQPWVPGFGTGIE